MSDPNPRTPLVTLATRGARLGSLFGVEIRMDWSLAIVFGLVLFDLALSVFPEWHPEWSAAWTWSTAFAAALLFFGSVLVHEMSHALVGRTQGVPVSRITLFLFGGIAHMDEEPRSPKAELLMAGIGPITSLAIGVAGIAGGVALSGVSATALLTDPVEVMPRVGPFATLLLWLGPVNVALGLFNLLPGFPLDGGRVLRATLWAAFRDVERATRWASRSGQLLAAGLAALGVWSMVGGGFGQGVWLLLIAWFLFGAARGSYAQVLLRERLKGVTLEALMRDDVMPVEPSMTLDRVVEERVIGTDATAFLVAEGSALLGEVTVARIHSIPRPEWPTTRVEEVMTPASALPSMSPGDPVDRALRELSRLGVAQVIVREAGNLIGVVRRQDIMRWLAFAPRSPHPIHP
ncbi:MAG: site-2 protease family protein [Sandaracinaceae bacterium]